MAVPAGVIVAWTGAHNGWPAGWTRKTALDGGRYTKGIPDTSTGPNVTGGATTHTHSQATHAHGSGSPGHSSHSISDGGGSGFASGNNSLGLANPGPGHGHAPTVGSGGAGATGGGGAGGFVGNSDPAYLDVIYIESDGSPTGFPNLSVAFWNTSTLPTGWRLCDGSSGAPSGGDRYMRGAATAGAGGGTGGSNTHPHTESTHSDHSAGSHNHTLSPFATNSGVESGTATNAVPSHNHTYPSTGSASPGVGGASATGSASSDSSEQPFRKVLFVQNNTGSASTPTNIIAMWLGSLASIPVGWRLCDGGAGTPNLSQGEYPKCGTTTSDFGSTGGASTHSHAGSGGATHNHGYQSHNHGGGTSSSVGTSAGNAVNGGSFNACLGHSHTYSVGSDAGGATGSIASNGAGAIAVDPLNTTIAYIANTVGGGGILQASD